MSSEVKISLHCDDQEPLLLRQHSGGGGGQPQHGSLQSAGDTPRPGAHHLLPPLHLPHPP